VHDAGFTIFNGSALQFLFFDDFDRAYFVRGAKPAVLRKSRARLERTRKRLAAAKARFAGDPIAHGELLYAADASIHALRKALAGLDDVAWRERPAKLDARARRRLASECTQLAKEERALLARLRTLWLARSRPSNFELTSRRLQRSTASLARAARALTSNRPPAPPPAHEGFSPGVVIRALRDAIAQQ